MLKKYSIKYLEKTAVSHKESGYEYKNGGWQWSPTKQDRTRFQKELEAYRINREKVRDMLDTESGAKRVINDGFAQVQPDNNVAPLVFRRSQADVLRSAGWTDSEINNYLANKTQVKNYSKSVSARTKHLMERQRELGIHNPQIHNNRPTYDFHAGLDAWDLDHLEKLKQEAIGKGNTNYSPDPYLSINRGAGVNSDMQYAGSDVMTNFYYGNDPAKAYQGVNADLDNMVTSFVDPDKYRREQLSKYDKNPHTYMRTNENAKEAFKAYEQGTYRPDAIKNKVISRYMLGVPDDQNDDNYYSGYATLADPDEFRNNVLTPYLNRSSMDGLNEVSSIVARLKQGDVKAVRELEARARTPQEAEVIRQVIQRYFSVNRNLMEQAQNRQIRMPKQLWDQGWFKKGY